jgi:hypothetical protein
MRQDEQNKILLAYILMNFEIHLIYSIFTIEFLNQLNLLHIYICLYLQYILNSVFTIVFYMTR